MDQRLGVDWDGWRRELPVRLRLEFPGDPGDPRDERIDDRSGNQGDDDDVGGAVTVRLAARDREGTEYGVVVRKVNICLRVPNPRKRTRLPASTEIFGCSHRARP